MRSRLDRAERAIEQERAAVRDLQAALQACRQVCPLHVHTANVAIPVPSICSLHAAIQKIPLFLYKVCCCV